MNSYDIGTHLALWDEILHYVSDTINIVEYVYQGGSWGCGLWKWWSGQEILALSLSLIVTEWVRRETEGECIIE